MAPFLSVENVFSQRKLISELLSCKMIQCFDGKLIVLYFVLGMLEVVWPEKIAKYLQVAQKWFQSKKL